MKRVRVGILGLAAAAIMFAAMPAHANVTVGFDQSSGDTMVSAPGLPDQVSYPPEVKHSFTGTASFGSADGSVFVQLAQVPLVNPTDPLNQADPIVIFTGPAALDCNGSFACTWSFRIPFVIGPGDYTATATASEPNVVNPDDPGPSASETIDITVL